MVVVAREAKFVEEDRLSQLRYDNNAADPGIPVLAISQQAAVSLLGAGNMAALVNLAADLSKTSSQSSGNPSGTATLASAGVINSVRRISIDISRNQVSATNVVGILEGTDPALKNEAIVIGAHYDHLGRGGQGSTAPQFDGNSSRRGRQRFGHGGACSNWRGNSPKNKKNKRTIIFIAFGGEEEGLLGSKHYVNNPVFPLEKTVAMINMDMVGRLNENKLTVGGIGTATDWRAMIENANVIQGVSGRSTGADIGGKCWVLSIHSFVGANGQICRDFRPGQTSSNSR